MVRQWRNHPWHNVPCMKARIEEVAARCHGKVLEVGAHDGHLTKCILEQGLDCVAVELDDGKIATAKNLYGEDFPIVKGDINALPYEDNSFDTVVGAEILEHLPNPGLGLSELFRVSRGHVILTLPIGEYWLGEKSHIWQLEGQTIEHDKGTQTNHVKELLVLEWIQRRELGPKGFVDLPRPEFYTRRHNV